MSTVYFTKEITPQSLVRIYEKLGREATGKVAVKISTGEPGGHNYLKPELIKDLVQKVHGTIVECNTAYGGRRMKSSDHHKAAEEHGFTKIAPVDIMDENGEIEIPVKKYKHLPVDIIGKNFLTYDFTVVLSHFKGHAMAGFGGAIKNISIGIASSNGKGYIHSAGKTKGPDFSAAQDDFLESMADAAEAIIDHCKDKILYINIANNISIDCDCDANAAPPTMGDIGIFASLDPVAVDKACVDAVYNSSDPGKAPLIKRMEEKHGIHTLETAVEHGLGSMEYKIVEI